MAIKLTVAGISLVAVAYCLRGHDILTGIALLVLFLVAVVKVVFAIIARRDNGFPPGDGGGQRPPDAPVPRPPAGRPPALSAAAQVRP